MLLKLGADPNRINPEGLVPLNLAVSDADLIRVLLHNGADVNAGTKGVLMTAIQSGDVDTLKLYLENGADCNVADASIKPIQRSLFGTTKPVLNNLPILEAAYPSVRHDWSKSTAAEMIGLLLTYGAKVEYPISEDQTLIHFLFQRASTSVLRPLIDWPGLEVNARDQRGRTIFMAACSSSIDHEQPSGLGYVSNTERDQLKTTYTPAYMALADCELHSASIDYFAVDNEGTNVVRYLLNHWTEEVAIRFLSVPGLRTLITQKDNKGFSPLHGALQSQKIEVCDRFIDDGHADLLEPDPNEDTALHHLFRGTYTMHSEKAKLLIERYLSLGGDLNLQNTAGETALHCFLAHHNQSLNPEDADDTDPLAFFVGHAANFRVAKCDGTTALHVVARRQVSRERSYWFNTQGNPKYNATLFRRLVELGCDPLQEDGSGRSALDIAALTGNEGILKMYQREKS